MSLKNGLFGLIIGLIIGFVCGNYILEIIGSTDNWTQVSFSIIVPLIFSIGGAYIGYEYK